MPALRWREAGIYGRRIFSSFNKPASRYHSSIGVFVNQIVVDHLDSCRNFGNPVEYFTLSHVDCFFGTEETHNVFTVFLLKILANYAIFVFYQFGAERVHFRIHVV